MNLQFNRNGTVLPKYRELERLVEQATIIVLFEVLVALSQTGRDAKEQNRLLQALMYLAAYSPWKRPLGVVAFAREIKCPQARSQAQSLLPELLRLIEPLPKVCGPEIWPQSLAPTDLEAELTEAIMKQERAQNSKLIAKSVQHYLALCGHLLTLVDSAQFLNHKLAAGETTRWRDFVVASSFLGRYIDAYNKMRKELAPLLLPPVPCLEIGNNLWMASSELVSGALNVYFNCLQLESAEQFAAVY